MSDDIKPDAPKDLGSMLAGLVNMNGMLTMGPQIPDTQLVSPTEIAGPGPDGKEKGIA